MTNTEQTLRERLKMLCAVAGDMAPDEFADDAISIFRDWLEDPKRSRQSAVRAILEGLSHSIGAGHD